MIKPSRRAIIAALSSSLAVRPSVGWAQPTAGSIVAPVEIFRNKLLLTVRVGERDWTAVYDSGASHSLLSAAALDATGLAATGRGRAAGFGGSQEVRVVRHLPVSIAGRELALRDVLVLDMAQMIERFGRRFDMILGLDVFPGSVAGIDVERSTLTFTPRAAFVAPADAERLPLARQGRNITSDIDVAGERVRANFDLGASDAVTIGPNLARRLGIDFEALPKTLATGVGGDHVVGLTSAPSVRVAGVLFADTPLHVSEAPLPIGEANLGFDLLSRFRIALDLDGGSAFMSPIASLRDTPFLRDLAGVRLSRPTQNALAVLHVSPSGPADAGGLVAGGHITAIDGAAISDLSPDADITAWTRREGAVALTLASGQALQIVRRRFY